MSETNEIIFFFNNFSVVPMTAIYMIKSLDLYKIKIVTLK